jgi:hypothetical protein
VSSIADTTPGREKKLMIARYNNASAPKNTHVPYPAHQSVEAE